MKPIWLLDFDGVVNVNPGKPRWGAAPRKTVVRPGNGGEYTVRWAPALVDRIRDLHRSGLVEVRWCSTWIGYTDVIERMLGLPHFEPAYIRPKERQPVNPHPRLKLAATLNAIESDRPVIWTDDDAIPAYMLDPAVGPTWDVLGVLLIAPQPNRGLLPEHMDAIEAFATAQTATEVPA